MKFPRVIFSILNAFILLLMTATFTAGSLIFLIIQLFDHIFEMSGFWIALGTVSSTTVVIFCGLIALIKNNFFSFFYPKAEKLENRKTENAGITKKILVSVLIFELSKLITKFLHHHYDKKHEKHS